jgi:hypothetical protein
MSAYLASNDAISALTTYWEQSARLGNYTTPRDQLTRAHAAASDRSGFGWNHHRATTEAQDLIHEHGTPERAVFALLLAENIRSLEARYPDSPEMWSAAELYRFSPSASVQRWMHYAPHGHGHLVGMASSYAYQACEHDGWPCSVAYQLIEQIRSALLRDLERRDCKEGGQGASFEEPAPDPFTPQPVSLSGLALAASSRA